jgi:hypothetical protein
VGTIVNDDALPTLSISDPSVDEGNSGTTNLVFVVTLSSLSTQLITVRFATADGTATAPSDYATGSGTLSFSPGVTTRNVTVAVQGDTQFEPSETVIVNLTNPNGATLLKPGGTGTIQNDDAAGATPWRNANNPLDVDANLVVVNLDALIVINRLDAVGSGPLTNPPVPPEVPPPFYDTSGDNVLAPLDALLVINFLDSQPMMAPLADAGEPAEAELRAAGVAVPAVEPVVLVQRGPDPAAGIAPPAAVAEPRPRAVAAAVVGRRGDLLAAALDDAQAEEAPAADELLEAILGDLLE